MKCELCTKAAVVMVDRIWEDGTIDINMTLCEEHGKSDPNGMWTMQNIRRC